MEADGRTVSHDLIDSLTGEELDKIRAALGDERFARGRFEEARELFSRMTRARECPGFLTTLAYDLL